MVLLPLALDYKIILVLCNIIFQQVEPQIYNSNNFLQDTLFVTYFTYGSAIKRNTIIWELNKIDE